MDFAVNQVVADGLAVVCLDFHKGGFLSGVLKDNRVLFVGEDIMLVGGKFFEIEAAKRQISLAVGVSVFVNGKDFKQSVCRNNRAVRCGQILGSEQAKGYGRHFTVCTDSELLVLF